jgi:Sugar (and other) transporter
MDSKIVIEGATAQAVITAVDIGKKAEIAHEEHLSSPPSISKVPVSTGLAPKEQYRRPWINLKKDKHFVLSALYVMSLVLRWSFRLAFIMTFLVPGIFLFELYFLPESPVWYMKKGREKDTCKAIVKLFRKNFDVKERLSVIKSELEMMVREAHNASQTSWKVVFSKAHRSRTFVAVLGF